MKTSKYLFTVMTVALLTLAGCGGSSGGDSTPPPVDDATGGGTNPIQSTFSSDSGDKFLTKLDTIVPGCTYVENSTSPSRYSGALAGTFTNVRLSEPFRADGLVIEDQTLECKNTSATVEGAIVVTANEDSSQISADFQNCALGSFTQQNTKVNGLLNISFIQDTVTGEPISVAASTGNTGVTVVDTDADQDVTLVMTGTNEVTMGENTQADPTVIDMSHVALTDRIDATQSFVIDNCKATIWQSGENAYLNLEKCTYADTTGTFTNSGEFVTNNATGMTSGALTSIAGDGTKMVMTMDDSTGLIDVAIDGASPVTLDCTDVDTDALGDLTESY